MSAGSVEVLAKELLGWLNSTKAGKKTLKDRALDWEKRFGSK